MNDRLAGSMICLGSPAQKHCLTRCVLSKCEAKHETLESMQNMLRRTALVISLLWHLCSQELPWAPCNTVHSTAVVQSKLPWTRICCVSLHAAPCNHVLGTGSLELKVFHVAQT